MSLLSTLVILLPSPIPNISEELKGVLSDVPFAFSTIDSSGYVVVVCFRSSNDAIHGHDHLSNVPGVGCWYADSANAPIKTGRTTISTIQKGTWHLPASPARAVPATAPAPRPARLPRRIAVPPARPLPFRPTRTKATTKNPPANRKAAIPTVIITPSTPNDTPRREAKGGRTITPPALASHVTRVQAASVALSKHIMTLLSKLPKRELRNSLQKALLTECSPRAQAAKRLSDEHLREIKALKLCIAGLQRKH